MRRKPGLLWQLYYEGNDGQPRKARTRPEHKELDAIVDGRNKDDLFAVEWLRKLQRDFRAILKDDPGERKLGVTPVLLRNARRIEADVIGGCPYIRDLVLLMVYDSAYSAALVKGARLTRARLLQQRRSAGKKEKADMRRAHWIQLLHDVKKHRTNGGAILTLYKREFNDASPDRQLELQKQYGHPSRIRRTIERDVKVLFPKQKRSWPQERF